MIQCTEPGCGCPPGVCRVQAMAARWVVVWWSPERREAYFADHALADAYAAGHHGHVVPMVNLAAWPARACAGISSQDAAADATRRR